jgi:hypothetical protein
MATTAKPVAKPAAKPAPAAKTAAKPAPAASASRAVTAPVTGELSNQRPDFMKAGGRGAENVTTSDLVIPRLEVVQSLSPARNKQHADYIEGAEEGMLYNNVTRELYGESVTVVPCYFLKEWLIWKDRKKGGGFRGAYPTKAEADAAIALLKQPDGKAEDPADFTALDTAQQFCLLISHGKPQQIVVSMSKSKMKVSRKWNSMIALSDDDSFARAYRIDAVGDKNQLNQDFYNIKVTQLGYVAEGLYNAGEKMYNTLKAGGARADTSGMDHDDVAGPGAASAAGSNEF